MWILRISHIFHLVFKVWFAMARSQPDTVTVGGLSSMNWTHESAMNHRYKLVCAQRLLEAIFIRFTSLEVYPINLHVLWCVILKDRKTDRQVYQSLRVFRQCPQCLVINLPAYMWLAFQITWASNLLCRQPYPSYSTGQMQLKPHSRATRTAHPSAIKSTRECTKCSNSRVWLKLHLTCTVHIIMIIHSTLHQV